VPTTSLAEADVLHHCLAIRRMDLALTPEQQAASDAYARTHARRFALVLSRLAPLLPRPATVFSVGSMPNQLELLLARFFDARIAGSTYSPLDTRDKFTARYEHRDGWRCDMDVYLRDLTRDPLPVPPRSCDAVLCFEVVEHLRESPLPLFHAIVAALKPGGLLLLSTPNMQHWHRVLYLLNGLTYPDLDFDEPQESRHTHIFSFRELQRLLGAAGLEVVTSFSADPWDNARNNAHCDLGQPTDRRILQLLKDRDGFQHECLFLAARPADALPVLTGGWHATERDETGWWCWTKGRAEMRVVVKEDAEARLQGALQSIQHPNVLEIRVNGFRALSVPITWEGFRAVAPAPLLLRRGDNTIEFVSGNPPVTLPTDTRPLAVAVKNLRLRIGEHEQPVSPP
jgi:SAM-dependent methyltransferase